MICRLTLLILLSCSMLTGCASNYYWTNNSYSSSEIQQRFDMDKTQCEVYARQQVYVPQEVRSSTPTRYYSGSSQHYDKNGNNTGSGTYSGKSKTSDLDILIDTIADTKNMREVEAARDLREKVCQNCMYEKGWRLVKKPEPTKQANVPPKKQVSATAYPIPIPKRPKPDQNKTSATQKPEPKDPLRSIRLISYVPPPPEPIRSAMIQMNKQGFDYAVFAEINNAYSLIDQNSIYSDGEYHVFKMALFPLKGNGNFQIVKFAVRADSLKGRLCGEYYKTNDSYIELRPDSIAAQYKKLIETRAIGTAVNSAPSQAYRTIDEKTQIFRSMGYDNLLYAPSAKMYFMFQSNSIKKVSDSIFFSFVTINELDFSHYEFRCRVNTETQKYITWTEGDCPGEANKDFLPESPIGIYLNRL